MLATMLPLRFQGQEAATRKDYALAWLPLVTLDWSIVAFLVGLLLWYGEKSNTWRTVIVGSQTAALLAFVCRVVHETQGRTGKGGSAVFLKSAAMAPHKRQIGQLGPNGWQTGAALRGQNVEEKGKTMLGMRCAVGNVGNDAKVIKVKQCGPAGMHATTTTAP